jgi:hypothetical protein
MPTVYAYSTESPDTLGLDPERFTVTVAVHRKGMAALTPADIAAIKVALLAKGLAIPDEPEAPAKPAKAAPGAPGKPPITKARTKRAPAAPKRKAARVSKG